MRRTIRAGRAVAIGLAALVALAACGGDDENPLEESADTGSAGGAVTVGSANFPENALLAEIYAQALEAKGVSVTRKFNIGSREVIYGQIENGSLDVLPEYNGALLAYLDKTATVSSTEEVNQALRAKLPTSLELLDSAAAEDKDSVTVTQQTAQKYQLSAIPDLAPVAGDLVIGGPAEFKTRQQGLVGLESIYGVKFKQFKSLDVAGPITVSALEKGDVQAANLFTTDPVIAAKGFVVLEDPKNLFSAQNVTPLVHKESVNDTSRQALNAISAKLDTPTLGELVKKVVTDKEDYDKVAKDWLTTNGLV
jgi:osmoprotectant transport system substrate-binding protein